LYAASSSSGGHGPLRNHKGMVGVAQVGDRRGGQMLQRCIDGQSAGLQLLQKVT
jgi:hypothetical protein